MLPQTRINQLKQFSRITALFGVVLIALVTILGKGGGGGTTTPPPAAVDVAGTWTTMSTIIDDSCMLDPGDEQLGDLVITQVGNNVTIVDDDPQTYTGTLAGSVLSFSGSFVDGTATVTLTGMVTFNGDTFSGTVDFAVADPVDGNCGGTLQVTGTRMGGGVAPGPIALNPANAEMVTSVVLQAASNVQDLPLGVTIDGASASPATVAGIIAEQVSATIERMKMGALPVGVIVVTDCGIDASFGTITTDTIGMPGVQGSMVVTTYQNCDFGDGRPLSGGFTLTFTDVMGSVAMPPYTLVSSITFMQFGSLAAPSFFVDGDATVTASSPDGVVITTQTGLVNLTYTVDGVSQEFSDYTTILVLDLSDGSTTFSAQGTVEIPPQNTVMFETIGSFMLFEAGQVLITGDGSTIDCVALDNVTINLNIDSDGDGIVDETVVTTWVELLAGVNAG